MNGERVQLIRQVGGRPVCAPAVRELPSACDRVKAFLNDLRRGGFDIAIFLSGAGAKALFEAADRLERRPELLIGLKHVTTVCRGLQPVAVLKRNGLAVGLIAPEPYTTAELLQALAGLALAGKGVALLHYGERNPALTEALRARGARLTELCLYERQLPEDLAPLRRLVRNLVDGQLDAVAFTSQLQVHYLFQTARRMGLSTELLSVLNTTVMVGSNDPACTAALQEFGVARAVIAQHPQMGRLVAALAAHVEQPARRHET
ncbi:MAG TPA: uroporphyrinogen-III synthase [Anaerolineae bacterium]|nr:uroporphyrinogen-III synthase [Anaerolineae bacterium]